MRRGIIYKYTNYIDGKVYIGQTIDEYKRKFAHEKCYGIWRSHFHSAIKKYGYDAFIYEVLEEYNLEDSLELKKILDKQEIFYIAQYDSTNPDKGYNITSGGGGTIGVKQSEESKIKRSIAMKGRKSKLTKEQWKYIQSCNKHEYKAHISPVEKYTLDGEFIQRFDTLKEAAASVESTYRPLLRALKRANNKGVFKNFYWKKC